MTNRAALFALLTVSAGQFSVSAHAAPYLFELSGSRNAVFTVDSNQSPSFLSSSVFGDQISFSGVAGTYGGVAGMAEIGFGTGLFAALNVGGTPLGFTQFAGPALFTLVDMKPAFSIGTFNLTSIVSGSSTLRISAVSAPAVPEPASWAMMVAGIAMLGGVMRRRQARVSFA